MARPAKHIVQPGDVFGRLTVLELTHLKTKRAAEVRCICGTEKVVEIYALVSKAVKSCGCWRVESGAIGARKRNEEHGNQWNLKHGFARRPNGQNSTRSNLNYDRWAAMMSRCHSPGSTWYYAYGDRGIEVYKPWHDVVVFLDYLSGGIPVEPAYDGVTLASEPPPLYSLDRIDNNGNYEPGNIRWADPKTQCRFEGRRVPMPDVDFQHVEAVDMTGKYEWCPCGCMTVRDDGV